MQKLQEDYPQEKLTGFFYDPNIHPYSEYYLRMIDAKRSCEKLGFDFVEGEYDVEGWLEAVRGLEMEPEKGKRCKVCFDNRLETSAKQAHKMGEKMVTTTLLMSPLKDLEQLKAASADMEKEYDLEFITPDYRKGGGTQAQMAMSKENQAYHQNYCGCLFGLNPQREHQQRLASELFTPIGNTIIPGSIESRVKLYEKRMLLEEEGKSYHILKENIQCYRLLGEKVVQQGEVLASFSLPFSILKPKVAKGRVAFNLSGIHFFNRNNIRLIDIAMFNQLSQSSFTNVKELIFSDIAYDRLLDVRRAIIDNSYDTTPIIVLDKVDTQSMKISINSKIYEDQAEVLLV